MLTDPSFQSQELFAVRSGRNLSVIKFLFCTGSFVTSGSLSILKFMVITHSPSKQNLVVAMHVVSSVQGNISTGQGTPQEDNFLSHMNPLLLHPYTSLQAMNLQESSSILSALGFRSGCCSCYSGQLGLVLVVGQQVERTTTLLSGHKALNLLAQEQCSL